MVVRAAWMIRVAAITFLLMTFGPLSFDSIPWDDGIHRGSAGQALAQSEGHVPGETLGNTSDTQLWRAIREGETGKVAGQTAGAGVMIQSEGELWRSIRNGPIATYGVWGIAGMIALLSLFLIMRGRIEIDAGWSDRRLLRFNGIERFAHWLTAGTFVVLAITGLNLLYGRYVLLPVLGPEIFSWLTQVGKYAHNYLSFPFMLGLTLMFVLWVVHNLPDRTDINWILKGGGLFTKGTHPPAKKFNAGQKIVFWTVILGGFSLSLSGIALLFPFQFTMFSDTFAAINGLIGTSLPTNLQPLQEQQLAQGWHAIVGLIMTAFIFAHIYIGSIGMQGAFDAMGNGWVDANWAKEHHSLWVKQIAAKKIRPSSDASRARSSTST